MFSKFLLTVAVVAIIWFGFKYLQRIAELRAGRPSPPNAPRPPSAPNQSQTTQDLALCPRCATYRAPNQGPCGRKDCPY